MSNFKYIDIEEFNGLDVTIDYEDIIKEYGDKAVKRLKENSPKQVAKKPRKSRGRRRKKYKDSWTTKETKKSNQYEVLVYNKENWQLTHLLENGHLIVNKKNGVGWASAKPHITPTYQTLKPRFIAEMKSKSDIVAKFK